MIIHTYFHFYNKNVKNFSLEVVQMNTECIGFQSHNCATFSVTVITEHQCPTYIFEF